MGQRLSAFAWLNQEYVCNDQVSMLSGVLLPHLPLLMKHQMHRAGQTSTIRTMATIMRSDIDSLKKGRNIIVAASPTRTRSTPRLRQHILAAGGVLGGSASVAAGATSDLPQLVQKMLPACTALPQLSHASQVGAAYPLNGVSRPSARSWVLITVHSFHSPPPFPTPLCCAVRPWRCAVKGGEGGGGGAFVSLEFDRLITCNVVQALAMWPIKGAVQVAGTGRAWVRRVNAHHVSRKLEYPEQLSQLFLFFPLRAGSQRHWIQPILSQKVAELRTATTGKAPRSLALSLVSSLSLFLAVALREQKSCGANKIDRGCWPTLLSAVNIDAVRWRIYSQSLSP